MGAAVYVAVQRAVVFGKGVDDTLRFLCARVKVILECTEHKASGMPGTSRYYTMKNKKNTPDRLELMKYNPILKKMTLHKEIK